MILVRRLISLFRRFGLLSGFCCRELLAYIKPGRQPGFYIRECVSTRSVPCVNKLELKRFALFFFSAAVIAAKWHFMLATLQVWTCEVLLLRRRSNIRLKPPRPTISCRHESQTDANARNTSASGSGRVFQRSSVHTKAVFSRSVSRSSTGNMWICIITIVYYHNCTRHFSYLSQLLVQDTLWTMVSHYI